MKLIVRSALLLVLLSSPAFSASKLKLSNYPLDVFVEQSEISGEYQRTCRVRVRIENDVYQLHMELSNCRVPRPNQTVKGRFRQGHGDLELVWESEKPGLWYVVGYDVDSRTLGSK